MLNSFPHIKDENNLASSSSFNYNKSSSIYTKLKPDPLATYDSQTLTTSNQTVDTPSGIDSETSSVTTRRSSRLIGKTQPTKSKYIETEDDEDEVIKDEKGMVEVDDDTKYLISIDRILDDRETKDGQIEYLVKYRNLSYLHLNWETEDFIIDNRKRWKYSIMKYETNKQKNEIEALDNSKYESESDLDISTTSSMNYKKYQCVDRILLHKKCMLEINKDTYLIGWRVLQDLEETTAKQLIKYSPNKKYFKLNLDEFEELVKIAEERGVSDVIPALMKMNPDIELSEPDEEDDEENNNEKDSKEDSKYGFCSSDGDSDDDDNTVISFGNNKKKQNNKKKKTSKNKNKVKVKEEKERDNNIQQDDMKNFTLSNTNDDIYDDIDMDKDVKDSIFIEETLYLCKWKGLDYELATWERAEDFKDNAKIKEYFQINTVPPEIANSDISDFIGKDDLLFLEDIDLSILYIYCFR